MTPTPDPGNFWSQNFLRSTFLSTLGKKLGVNSQIRALYSRDLTHTGKFSKSTLWKMKIRNPKFWLNRKFPPDPSTPPKKFGTDCTVNNRDKRISLLSPTGSSWNPNFSTHSWSPGRDVSVPSDSEEFFFWLVLEWVTL
jgi:hypothetical protein